MQQSMEQPRARNYARQGQTGLGDRLIADLSLVMLHGRLDDSRDIVLDDVRLVGQLAAGEAAALGRFYDRWSAQVYATVISIVRSAEDAEEIVDDCFWQAWQQASRFDSSRGQVRSWILNIARSRALDRLKAVKRRREEALEAAPSAMFAVTPDAEERLDEETRAGQVAVALKLLPSAQREVLEMAYYGGLSQTEIADSTGEALGTVKTRVRLGMQKLREVLGPMERSHS
ncbi:MAG: sigma-70 family RNA polymerase sigma factor [Gemmatimonadaceae bacterium]